MSVLVSDVMSHYTHNQGLVPDPHKRNAAIKLISYTCSCDMSQCFLWKVRLPERVRPIFIEDTFSSACFSQEVWREQYLLWSWSQSCWLSYCTHPPDVPGLSSQVHIYPLTCLPSPVTGTSPPTYTPAPHPLPFSRQIDCVMSFMSLIIIPVILVRIEIMIIYTVCIFGGVVGWSAPHCTHFNNLTKVASIITWACSHWIYTNLIGDQFSN